MERKAGLRRTKRVLEITHAPLATSQYVEDCEPSLVRKRLEQTGTIGKGFRGGDGDGVGHAGHTNQEMLMCQQAGRTGRERDARPAGESPTCLGRRLTTQAPARW